MLETIYEPIQEDLAKVGDLLRSVYEVDPPRLFKPLTHSLMNGGKKIRPALVLLSGKFHNYNLSYFGLPPKKDSSCNVRLEKVGKSWSRSRIHRNR